MLKKVRVKILKGIPPAERIAAVKASHDVPKLHDKIDGETVDTIMIIPLTDTLYEVEISG